MDENLLSTKTINQRQIQNAIAIVEKKIKKAKNTIKIETIFI